MAMIALGGVVAGVLFVGYAFVWSPLADAYERRAKADEEYQKKSVDLNKLTSENDSIVKLHPRVGQWKKLSVPPSDPALKKPGSSAEDKKQLHVSRMKTEYEKYLSDVMRRNGMKAETVKVVEKPPSKVGSPPSAPKGMQPVYERLAFSVSAIGPQEATYRSLREVQSTNLLHEIRSLTVGIAPTKGRDKPDPQTLELSMLVEALMVTGAEDRDSIMPKQLAFAPRILAEPSRDYSLMSKRSLFTGLAEPPRPPVIVKKDPPKKEEPDEPPPPRISERQRLEALEFVKVTMLAYNPNRLRWEATLYDQAQGEGNEIRLDTRLFKSFTIYNDETPVLEAKVLWIDEEQIIFTAEGKHFRAKIGEFLDNVWKSPLSASEVKKLGL
ncbi:MAG: hypothetical protein EBV06_12000 [Planctomycetia bacterium]|nr:hypothetical protein [Planctomycetia bacterium]